MVFRGSFSFSIVTVLLVEISGIASSLPVGENNAPITRGRAARNAQGNYDYDYQVQPLQYLNSGTSLIPNPDRLKVSLGSTCISFAGVDPEIEKVLDLSAKSILYSSAAQSIAQDLMIHNQEVMSQPGKTPLFKQSYPGLYSKGDLKVYGFEPTMPITHGNSHHGREGHLFLQGGSETARLYPETSEDE